MDIHAKESSLKILMFPWLGHGHVFPFLELSKKLSERNFHIYFFSTPIMLDSVRASLDDDDNNNNNNRIELVELRLRPHPDLPPHYHSNKNVPPHLMPTLREVFQESAPPAFSDVITELKPDLVVYDVMQPWAAKMAASRGIPCVYFSTVAAATFAYGHHLHTHESVDGFPFEAIFLREHEKTPNDAVKVKAVGEGFLFGVFDLSNDVVLFKTSRAVEGKYMDYLSTLCKRKVVPTGPLITFDGGDEGAGGGGGGSPDILKWLGERERGSTLYISFGSENYLTAEQMREIAKGLELSGVSFVWVARKPAGGRVSVEEAAPEGFLERVRGRGIVAGWAPQAAILDHPSVGGFMSLCAWSSVTESLYFGVPVVAVPLNFDQPLQARVVVEAGVGVEVERDGDGRIDGKGVAEAVREVLGGERYRSRAREMREKMRAEEEEACDEMAVELTKLCTKPRE